MVSNNTGGSWLQRIPPATRVILLLCVGVWLVGFISPSFNYLALRKLGLHFWEASAFNPIQLVTYLFVHGNFMHLFFNMFALFSFGALLERVWGTQRFLIFYFVCGVGAGLVQEVIWACSWQTEYISAVAMDNHRAVSEIKDTILSEISEGATQRMANVAMFQNLLVTIGASGAIFGLLVGFAFVFPNMPMYLFFIPVPIKAKYMMIGYGLIELVFGVSGTLSSVAHYAHLGGMVFGLVLVYWYKKKGTLHGRFF